jgi:hypothetical protein
LGALRQRKDYLTGYLEKIQPPWTLFLLGSVIYGINSNTYGNYQYGNNEFMTNNARDTTPDIGNLDDLDAIMVLPDGLNYQEFVNSINTCFSEEQDFLITSLPENPIYTDLFDQDADCSIVRMQVKVFGVDLNIHIMTERDLRGAIKNPGSPFHTFLPNDPKYDREYSESIIGSDQEPKGYSAELRVLEDKKMALLTEYIFRAVENEQYTLGVVGSKLLTAAIIYESEGMEVASSFNNLLSEFVRIGKRQGAESTEQLMEAIGRYHRFSDKFIAELKKRLDYFFYVS